MRTLILVILLGLSLSSSINIREMPNGVEESFIATKRRAQNIPQAVSLKQLNDLTITNEALDPDFYEEEEKKQPETAHNTVNKRARLSGLQKLPNNNVVQIQSKSKEEQGSQGREDYFYFTADTRKGSRKSLMNDSEEEVHKDTLEKKTDEVQLKHVALNINAEDVVKKFLSF